MGDTWNGKPIAVPSYASAMISNYRRSCNIPKTIGDGIIFSLLEWCRGMDAQDIEDAVQDELGTKP